MDNRTNDFNSAEERSKAIAAKLAANMANQTEKEYSELKKQAEVNKSSNKKTVKVTIKKSKKKKGKKKKNTAKKIAVILCTTVGVTILALGGAFFAGCSSHKGKFLDNTYINSVDVSGKTKEEAVKLLEEKGTIPKQLTIQTASGDKVAVKLSDLGHNDITAQKVSEYFEGVSSTGWFAAKFKNTEYTFYQNFSYDKKKLEKILDDQIVKASGKKKSQDAYIKKSDGKNYTVVPEVIGDTIDKKKAEKLYKYVESYLDKQAFTVDLTGANIYKKPKITAEKLQSECDKLNNIYNIKITFDFDYATETLTGDQVISWIKFDGDKDHFSGYSVDEKKAEKYVETLADKYDTYGKERKFKTTKRGTVTIKSGEGSCLGWWIDQKKTASLIADLIEEGDSANTKPIYYKSPDSSIEYVGNVKDRTPDKDWGNTYIEVDLSAQHLWYYENGKVKMQSDIVSGYSGSAARNTPGGAFKLWYKERAKTLVGSADGQSYASYVDYWNNISTCGIGLHDASWQNGVFGGTKYQTATWGSHGCVNMPFDKAKYVFENIELGTPVFMYW